MCLFVESIKLLDGVLFNLNYHQDRMDRTILSVQNKKNSINLLNELKIPDKYSCGLYKVRVLYDEKINSIEFLPYTKRYIHNIKLVEADINYSFKYADRFMINRLLEINKGFDDIIITTNGFVRDSSSANIVFYDGKKWVTPSTPLLAGTKRALLLDQGAITEEEIKISDIKKFQKISLINAMLDIGEVILSVQDIF